jgi:hypothetical protein
MQASTRSRNKPMQGRNFPERPRLGTLPTADLVAAFLERERASYGGRGGWTEAAFC